MPQLFKRKILKYLSYLKPTFLVGTIMIVIFAIYTILKPISTFVTANNISKEFISSLLFNSDPPLKSYKGRTNIAILGIAGGIHDGADLTDTIIVLSADFKKNDVLMISIPRDIYLPSLKDKINSAYHYGEEKQKGGGLVMAKSAMEEVVGLPMHYSLLIDFSGFIKVIDLVNGVDIYIEKAFTDNFYPIEGQENDFCSGDPTFACRYEKLHFDKGWQRFDGKTALKYVRSRQAVGDEGTDFARDKRQQQVILALKNKILKSNLWNNPTKIRQIISTFNDVFTTDMNWSEKTLLFKYFISLKEENVRHVVLDTGDEEKGRIGLLINPPEWEYNEAWVLVPRDRNFAEIHKFVSCELQNLDCPLK